MNKSSSTLPRRRAAWLRSPLLLSVLALVAVVAVFEITPLDFRVSDHFYDASKKQWLVQHGGLARTIFYQWTLRLVKIFGVVVFLALLVPRRWLAPRWSLPKDKLLVVFLALMLVPSLAGSLKRWTGMFCPRQLVQYGGRRPSSGLLESAEECCGGLRGRCWPAGHASGGFALMSLAVLGATRRQKLAGLAVGLLTGWTMGLYQMLNGNHFLSHTVVTMVLAWLVVLLLERLLPPLLKLAGGFWPLARAQGSSQSRPLFPRPLDL